MKKTVYSKKNYQEEQINLAHLGGELFLLS